MLIDLGGLGLSEWFGTHGGTTMSRYHNFKVIKNRGQHLGRNSQLQSVNKAIMSNVIARWGGLTDAQRLSWKIGAQQNQAFYKNYFSYLSQRKGGRFVAAVDGYYVYLSVNCKLMEFGFPFSTNWQSLDMPSLPTTFGIINTPGSISLSFSPSPIPANTAYQISCSRGYSSGITSTKIGTKIIRTANSGSTSPIILTGAYATLIGNYLIGAPFKTVITALCTVSGLYRYSLPFEFIPTV